MKTTGTQAYVPAACDVFGGLVVREESESEAPSTWCDTSEDSISACVVLKDGYKITKASASFTRAACGSGEINFVSSDENATATPPMFGSNYKFLVKDAGSYKCARFTFYGHKKR